MATFYALCDDNTVVKIEADNIAGAFDKEPSNAHWMYSEEGLREVVGNATEALKGE